MPGPKTNGGCRPLHGQPQHWSRYPVLVQFEDYLIGQRISEVQSQTHCRDLLGISQQTGLSVEEIAGCDSVEAVDRYFSNQGKSSRAHKRATIRRFQAFWQANELSGNSGQLIEGVPA